MLTRLIKIAVLGVPAVFVAGCASMSPNNYGLDAGNALLVRQTCNDIMGLNAGPELGACTSSLAESVLALQAAEVLVEADQSCAQRGFAVGTPELAQCVVMFRRAAAANAPSTSRNSMTAQVDRASVARTTNAGSSVTESVPKKFYFHMTQSERDERAELSCAQLGLHPAWGSFRQCVFNLQYAIVDVRYSMPPN